MSTLPPVPPFTLETARQKVKAAQDKWNTCDPSIVSPAYIPDCVWRNRDDFFSGTAAIEAFLQKKWAKEKQYKLKKQLFAFSGDRIAVEFWYEYCENGQWRRTYGIEHWVFETDGRMKSRQMSGNEIEIKDDERWFKDGVDVTIPPGHVSI